MPVKGGHADAGVFFNSEPIIRESESNPPGRVVAYREKCRFRIRTGKSWHLERIHFDGLGVSRQLDLYPPSGWRIIQDFAAAAPSIPT